MLLLSNNITGDITMSIIGYSFTNKNGKTKWMCISVDRYDYERFHSGVSYEISEKSEKEKRNPYSLAVNCRAITETFEDVKSRVDELISKSLDWDICDSPILKNGFGYYYLHDKRIWKLFMN